DDSFTGQSYFLNPPSPNAAPYVVSLNRESPPTSPSNSASVVYRVAFSKSVSGVDASDFMPTATGTLTFASNVVVSGSGASYLVTVNGLSGSGALGLKLVDDGTIRDGNNRRLVSQGAAFANQVTYAAPSSAPSIVTADVDNDGKLDLVMASASASSFGVMLGN